MPLYRIEVECNNEGELETVLADGRWDCTVVEAPRREMTKHVKTVTVIDPDTCGRVEVEIRKLVESGVMVGFDGSYLDQLGEDEHPLNPYENDCLAVIPDNEDKIQEGE